MAERTAPALNIFGQRTGLPDAGGRSAQMRARLERYFELSVFLLLTSGFVTIAVTGALDFPSVAFVSLALLVRGWFLLAGRSISIPKSWDTYISYGYITFYAADYFLLGRGFVNATIHLVLFSMAVKLFSVRRDRDYLYLAVLAFLEVLAASVLTVDSLFLGSFCMFALLAVNTFVAFEIRRSWAASSARVATFDAPSSEAYAPGRFTRSLCLTAVTLIVGMVAIGAALFFVLPRVAAGYFNNLIPRSGIEAGFSEEVSFGQIGEIQLTNAVAMHVEIFGDRTGAHDLKWRGVALALFDGRVWTNPLPRIPVPPETPGCFNVSAGDERAPAPACYGESASGPKVIRYRVLMEPMTTSVFFMAPNARSLMGRYRQIAVDAAGAVYKADDYRPIGAYEATSDLAQPDPAELRDTANAYPGSLAIKYLQLPPGLDPRVQRLAKEITAGTDNAYDKAAAIEKYLQTNYAYTLQLPKTIPADPVAEFLFERKAGHCEYFATAMAIMLRTIGIPSRIVNGFRGGEFNGVSGKYIVRSRDAHSWVEVYFPGRGWVAFDPTPASGTATGASASRTELYLDAMRDFWREWIVNYDFGHQRTLGSAGTMRAIRTIQDMRRWGLREYVNLLLRGYGLHRQVAARAKTWTYWAICGAVLVLLLANLGRIRRGLRDLRLSRNPQSAPEAAASLWYRRMTRALARRGEQKKSAQTANEFAKSITDPALRHAVARFTEHYERARFSDSATDAQHLPALYDAVREGCRKR